jgi:hypothetical protein
MVFEFLGGKNLFLMQIVEKDIIIVPDTPIERQPKRHRVSFAAPSQEK